MGCLRHPKVLHWSLTSPSGPMPVKACRIPGFSEFQALHPLTVRHCRAVELWTSDLACWSMATGLFRLEARLSHPLNQGPGWARAEVCEIAPRSLCVLINNQRSVSASALRRVSVWAVRSGPVQKKLAVSGFVRHSLLHLVRSWHCTKNGARIPCKRCAPAFTSMAPKRLASISCKATHGRVSESRLTHGTEHAAQFARSSGHHTIDFGVRLLGSPPS